MLENVRIADLNEIEITLNFLQPAMYNAKKLRTFQLSTFSVGNFSEYIGNWERLQFFKCYACALDKVIILPNFIFCLFFYFGWGFCVCVCLCVFFVVSMFGFVVILGDFQRDSSNILVVCV